MQENILYFFKSHAHPLLDSFFIALTMLGEQYFIILVVAWIYWNYSKKDGLLLTVIFIFSTLINSVLKDIVRSQRPFQSLEGIEGKRVHTAGGYSFPSGHTQGATTLFITLALIFRNRNFWIIAIILSLLVALSRMYLGVHWPVDVMGALLFGTIISLVLYPWLNRLYLNKKSFVRFLWGSLMLYYLVFLVITLINYFSPEQLIKPGYYLRLTGIISGVIPGFILAENVISFSEMGSIVKKIIRFVAGILTGVGIFGGLKLLLPEADIFMFIRYFFLGAWVSFIFPFIGLKIKLFEKPKSEIPA